MDQKSKRILVVDDEVFICELFDEFLTLQGYSVITATDGEEAVSKFESNRPDLVLLDIRMPGMSGIDVLGRIKEIDDSAGVIILSAFGDVETVEKALSMGAYRYMQKPVELFSLLDTLNNYHALTGTKKHENEIAFNAVL